MAVRGLGCPVRFALTAGQKGDAPQAAALIEGLSAEVVIADTAYDADHLRRDIAAKKALAVILTTCHAHSNIRSTSISMPSAISWNAASPNSSSSAASPPASKKPPEITEPSSLSLLSSYGCDKCPHCLGRHTGRRIHAAPDKGDRCVFDPGSGVRVCFWGAGAVPGATSGVGFAPGFQTSARWSLSYLARRLGGPANDYFPKRYVGTSTRNQS